METNGVNLVRFEVVEGKYKDNIYDKGKWQYYNQIQSNCKKRIT